MKKLALLVLGVLILTGCGGPTELKVGHTVDATARVTRNTYEHPIDPPNSYPYAAYVRLDGEETVLYAKDPVRCKLGQSVKFNGRVRAATAVPEGETEEVTELHIVLSEFECTGNAYEPEASGINVIEIENIFKDKIVYGSGLEEQDTKAYKEDCEARAGTFNKCGSPCEPGEGFCIEVCAYTCDF